METLLFVVLAFFAGYKYAPTQPPEQVIIQHDVLVSVPCKITSPDLPVMPLTDSGKIDEDIFIKTKKALAEIEIRKGYELKLESAIRSCQ